MKTQLEATVIGGGLQLDQQLTLPDQCRVRVEIVPLDDRVRGTGKPWKNGRNLASGARCT